MGSSLTTSPPERPAITSSGADTASDEALMRRIAEPKASRGEIETGMEALVARRAKEVWRYFVRRGAKPHTADDLTQEVFLRVLRERSRFDTAQAFAPSLAALSEGDRELLCLTRFEGLTYEKAAGIVGCSAGAAKVRAFRALEKLRKWMLEGGDA
ncbi:MAG: sigma-70 family RNA polymerase sigma factor [Planctomycetes bacterium]|nr:sigma-70 family RNA polymerase sigma factor [Planctomycetota bacterium]